jgi:hypothetical protein
MRPLRPERSALAKLSYAPWGLAKVRILQATRLGSTAIERSWKLPLARWNRLRGSCLRSHQRHETAAREPLAMQLASHLVIRSQDLLLAVADGYHQDATLR